MKRGFLSFLLVAVALTGCLSVDCGYAPNDPIATYRPSATYRYPVTYSVTVETLRPEITCSPDRNDLRDTIEEKLKATGLFSDVMLAPAPTDETYHFDFKFKVSGYDLAKAKELKTLSYYTLCLFPTWDEYTFDGELTVTLRKKVVCRVGATEAYRLYRWLPLAPFGLIWNSATGWWMVEKGVVNGLINGATTFHYEQYCQER